MTSPFDIVRAAPVAPKTPEQAAERKRLDGLPGTRKIKKFAEDRPPGAATPRVANWMAGQYVPSSAMRDAVARARLAQPPTKSLDTKELSCTTETTSNAPAAAGPTTP